MGKITVPKNANHKLVLYDAVVVILIDAVHKSADHGRVDGGLWGKLPHQNSPHLTMVYVVM